MQRLVPSASGLFRHRLLSLKTTVIMEVSLALSLFPSLITHWPLKRNGAQIRGGRQLLSICQFSLLLFQRAPMQLYTYRHWGKPATQASSLPPATPLFCLSILFRLGSMSYILPEGSWDIIYTTNSHIRNWCNISSKARCPPADSTLIQGDLTIIKCSQNSQCTWFMSWAFSSFQRIR